MSTTLPTVSLSSKLNITDLGVITSSADILSNFIRFSIMSPSWLSIAPSSSLSSAIAMSSSLEAFDSSLSFRFKNLDIFSPMNTIGKTINIKILIV